MNTRMKMGEGEWGTIKLAAMQYTSLDREVWLGIVCNSNHKIRIPGSGVVLEITINSEPKGDPLIKRYKINSDKMGNVEATPVL